MSEFAALEKVGQIAGIGGIALGVLLLVFREVIRKNIFPNLSRLQAYSILRLIIVLTFVIALAGIAAWVWSDTFNRTGRNEKGPEEPQDEFKRVYYQGFDRVPEDELNQMWLKGESGDWRGDLAKSVFTLCNISQSESASYTSTFRYIKVGDQVEDLRDAKITVRIRLTAPGGRYSSAGILFRKTPVGPDYYAFVLNFGNTVSLMRREMDGLKVLWSRELPAGRQPADSVKLSMIGDGEELSMFANDMPIGEYREADPSTGNPGVFAYSTGCFEFDEFSLYQRASEN